jgi:hypothetical protein
MSTPPQDDDEKATATSGHVPPPGSLPKLPQTIFNLEKKDGSGSHVGTPRRGE